MARKWIEVRARVRTPRGACRGAHGRADLAEGRDLGKPRRAHALPRTDAGRPLTQAQDSAYEVWTRYVTSWALTVALIIAWAFPVAFVGTLSNLDDVCQQFRCACSLACGARARTDARAGGCAGCASVRACTRARYARD
jgi:hypothetical protein